jgi:hypothetical protein
MLRKVAQPSAMTPVLPQFTAQKKRAKLRELMRRESQIGATLFGPIPSGHQRDFFCLDARTWVWIEQWYDHEAKSAKMMQVQYEFQTRGVLKSVDGVAVGFVQADELARLLKAIYTYQQKVHQEIYQYPAPAM